MKDSNYDRLISGERVVNAAIGKETDKQFSIRYRRDSPLLYFFKKTILNIILNVFKLIT